MPKLWATTIETHRQEVRAAVVQATAELIAEHGLRGVNMSAIANNAGIGRATLYKYFPDVDAILAAWHEEQVTGHIGRLRAISEQPGTAHDRLRRVLSTYAEIRQLSSRHSGSTDLLASLHGSEGVHEQLDRLRRVVEELVSQAAQVGDVRDDVPAKELATFTLAAVSGAALAASKAAAGRLVDVTLDALRPLGAEAAGPSTRTVSHS